jgi:aromatic-L-amino-acid/L-tryptophan decarboxylase
MLKNIQEIVNKNLTLDPTDWENMRQLGHKMIDDMMDLLENIRETPVWKKIPVETKNFFKNSIPQKPQNINEIYEEFKKYILPYPKGNIHPRFWAWAQGTGTPLCALAEMLAASMNPNVAIGEHSSMYVDMQVVEWCKEMMNFPENSSGILLSGGSMANITALIVARNNHKSGNIRETGLNNLSRMVLYCSTETHSCIQKGIEALGLGSQSMRRIPVDENFKIIIPELVKTIENDLKSGLDPFCVVGNAGTVNTGAIDPLDELLIVCNKYNLWFHVDGALGALAKLVPEYSDRLKAIEQADSLAFDLHKWMYIPYEIGVTLIRDSEIHKNAFSIIPNYLLNHDRGLAAGPEPVNNYGLELSRGFKALKVWMSIKEHGLEKYTSMIRQNIAQAFYLAELISLEKELEIMAPTSLNVVCYRYKKESVNDSELNKVNKEILMRLQEQGIASPSSTILNNKYAIRVCILNHRSRKEDFEVLVKETVRIGRELLVNI